MMKILLKNAKILTLKDQRIINGEILVNGNKIAQIAKKINTNADRVINCEGNLLMPGFKNAHAHSGLIFLRGFAEEEKLEDWLNKCIFPFETRFEKGDIYHLSKLQYLEYLTSGITANFDMYYNIDEIKRASEDFGMRTVILHITRKSSVKQQEQKYRDFNSKKGLVTVELGLHADYTMSAEDLKKLSKVAHKLHAPIYTHCSETLKDVNNRIRKSHMTPPAYLNSFGLFDYGGGIFHGVHLTDKDIKLLKQKKVAICTCPSSNLKLASGIAPIKKLVDCDLKVAIGTDSVASNNATDMFREMHLTSILSKYRENDPRSVKTFEILKMATVNGAKLMNLNNADVLAKGKLADIIMIDLHQANMMPSHNIINDLVYSCNKINVKMTMIDGKILYYNHKFYLNEKVENIYRNAIKISKRLTQKR